MADRYVTLTATTLGDDISEVSIYHTSISPSNLIASGVTRAEILTGYTFLDDQTHDDYYVESDSPCDTDAYVNVAVSPTPTPTISNTPSVTPSITPSITVTPSVTTTPSITITPSITTTPSVTPSITTTTTPTPSVTITTTPTPSVTITTTPTPSVTITTTPTTTVTPSITTTPSVTPSVTITTTPTPSVTITTTPTTTVTPSITTTPSVTPSITTTPSVTPSITTTPSVTPSVTPSITNTPTVTPSLTPTLTPSLTPSITMTPSVTPSVAGIPPAYLIIEPVSIATPLATYMFNTGASFYGFNSGSGPTSNSDVETYMDFYSLSGGSGGVPSIIELTVPQSSGGNDSYGNAIVQYNFETYLVSSGTYSENAWYSFLIPEEAIGGSGTSNRQTYIDVSFGQGQNTFTNVGPLTSTYYAYSVTNPGGSFQDGTYRLYTTYSDTAFRIDNTSQSLYFKGGTIE